MSYGTKKSEDVWCGRIRLAALAEAYYLQGATMKRLAKAAGVSIQAVSSAFKYHGYRTKWTGKRNKITRRMILAAIKHGHSQRELAERHGVGQTTVSRAARDYGIEWPEPEYEPTISEEDLWWGLERGMSQSDLARALGVGRSTVARYCTRYGIDWKREKEAIWELKEMAA